MKGHVSLVGAGPGDPALLTRAAIARLRAAEFVLYDALVDDRILRYARRAQRFFVGKRAGRHAMTQTAIQALMIRAARRGRRVVRLKGGDPFVFGRGGGPARSIASISSMSSPSAAPSPRPRRHPVTLRCRVGVLVVSGTRPRRLRRRSAQLQPNR